MGILLPSPLTIYLLLRPLQRQQQKIAFIVITAVALAMWVTLKRITGKVLDIRLDSYTTWLAANDVRA
jgi:hypothetical protein